MLALHQTPILNVTNLAQSFTWFEKLGWTKRWDWGDPPDFGAVGSGACEIFLCVDCQGSRGANGVWLGIMVDEVDEVYQHCVAQGIEVAVPPTDREWNLREMCIRHPDGHMFRIGHSLVEEHEDRHGAPLHVERVDVPVRLERRLAAVLHDLAEHKGMSVTSCLEETLLHTFERLGGGVASPHTMEQLEYIQELKRKHRMDYDCHASYRFVEG